MAQQPDPAVDDLPLVEEISGRVVALASVSARRLVFESKVRSLASLLFLFLFVLTVDARIDGPTERNQPLGADGLGRR